MRFDRIAGVLLDILHQIDLAEQFIADLRQDEFERDVLRLYAVTRCLEIISEASRRLPDDLKTRHPEVQWREIAGAGNIYRHNYENVAPRLVWETVKSGLTPLKIAIDGSLCLAIFRLRSPEP
jgi:uncharacterized protein with HEPN domain